MESEVYYSCVAFLENATIEFVCVRVCVCVCVCVCDLAR